MRTSPSRVLPSVLACLLVAASPAGTGEAVAEAQGGNPFRALKELFSRGSAEAEAESAPVAADEQAPAVVESAAEPPRGGGRDSGEKASGFSLRKLFGGGPADEPAAAEGAGDEPVGSRADKFVALEDGVPVYFDGPLQNRPPDVVLEKGALVSVVKARSGWTDVLLATGRLGTVASDQIRKAKASDFPAEHLDLVVRPGEAAGSRVALGDPVLDDVVPIPVAPPALPESIDDAEGDATFATPMLLLPPLPGQDDDGEGAGAAPASPSVPD